MVKQINKTEVKKMKCRIVAKGFGGGATINLENENGYTTAKIDDLELEDYVNKKLKAGDFEISEQAKGNKYARITLK